MMKPTTPPAKPVQGSGKLMDADAKKLVAKINYEILSATTVMRIDKYIGQFNFDKPIDIDAKYTLEMQDGRQTTCFVKLNGIKTDDKKPPVYNYTFGTIS